MNLKLQKVGNSFMVTIPKYIKEKAGLGLGDFLELDYSRNTIYLKPRKKKKKPIMNMIGDLEVKNFNFKKSMQYIKEASYAR